jgi:hypothetical protein
MMSDLLKEAFYNGWHAGYNDPHDTVDDSKAYYKALEEAFRKYEVTIGEQNSIITT